MDFIEKTFKNQLEICTNLRNKKNGLSQNDKGKYEKELYNALLKLAENWNFIKKIGLSTYYQKYNDNDLFEMLERIYRGKDINETRI